MTPLLVFSKRLWVIVKACRSKYQFSLADYWLYLRFAEIPGSSKEFPKVEVCSQMQNRIQLQIGHEYYYWPTEANWDGLGWMYHEVFVPASKNPHAYEFDGAKITPGDRVVDAGACEGFFTRYALQSKAKVLSLEPVHSIAECLKYTFADEIREGQVDVQTVALGAKSRQAKLQSDQNHLYESHIGDTGSDIQVKTLDEILGKNRVDFIKMDIEGAEMDAIMGASQTLAKHKPRLSIAVYHAVENAHKVCKLIHEIRPDYHIKYRGIFAWDGCEPRPFMVYAW